MSVESATYVADFQAANPPATDPRSQGDDHLRLIKQVLQNTFTGASRAWQIPSTRALTTSYSVLKADGESVLYVSTAGGAVTLTLPALTSIDAGWKVGFVKTTSDSNPMFIAPPSGTLNSGGIAALAKARRCIPGVRCDAIWDGANWFVTRVLALPIGSMIEYAGSALPAGYEWPSGQTLSSAANYPEYNAAMGGLTTLDKRGRLGIPLDNLGGTAAGRLPSGIIAGSTLGAVGGVDAVAITINQMPQHRHGMQITDNGHTHNFICNGSATSTIYGTPAIQYQYYIGGGQGGQQYATTIQSSGTGVYVQDGSGNANVTTYQGLSQAHSNLQPSIMVSQILVVE